MARIKVGRSDKALQLFCEVVESSFNLITNMGKLFGRGVVEPPNEDEDIMEIVSTTNGSTASHGVECFIKEIKEIRQFVGRRMGNPGRILQLFVFDR